MKLIDKVGLAVNVCVGGVIALMVYKKAGFLASILGFLLGFFISYLCLVIIASVGGAIWRMWWNPLPMCKQGKCKGKDYKVWGNTTTSTYWVCKCGDKYCQRGRTFMFVNENGDLEPYMAYDGFFGRWHQDK